MPRTDAKSAIIGDAKDLDGASKCGRKGGRGGACGKKCGGAMQISIRPASVSSGQHDVAAASLPSSTLFLITVYGILLVSCLAFPRHWDSFKSSFLPTHSIDLAGKV